jgi:hypothetical protein
MMPKKGIHWILRQLASLRQRAREIKGFTSGTTRRRKDLLEVLSVINNPRNIDWYYDFALAFSDNGTTGKIILTPQSIFNKTDGKIIFEFPSAHNTHQTFFIIVESAAGAEVAKNLRDNLARQTMGFQFPIILKKGRKLIPIDPP